MKVSLNGYNKSLPSAVGAAVSGAFNLVGAGLQAAHSKRQQQEQMQHDVHMAGLNQKNILEQMEQSQEYDFAKMAQQNQYQLDQWNRENEYNDPSAVAARYRSAGINPRAAFGTGSASGAGIAGGLSSAPSGGAPSGSSTGSASNIMTSPPSALATLGSDILNGILAISQKRKMDAESLGLEIENKYKEIKTQTEINDAIVSLELKLEDKSLKRVERERIIAEISYLRKQSKKVESDISVNEQNVQESKKRERKLNAESQKLERINAFEQSIYNTPLEILNTVPGVATFISKNVRDRVESTVGKIDSEISNSQLFHEFMNFFNGVEGYDPIKKFIKKNWNSIADKLNEIDRKMGFKGKSLPKFD